MPAINNILADFAFLEDWDDKYRYLIELGRDLDALPADQHTEDRRVRGCVSQVWLDTRVDRDGGMPVLHFKGDSDAHIVKGLIAITLALYSGRPAAEIAATDAAETFRQLGLDDHLTPQRSNGVRAMVDRIKADARSAEAA